MKRGKTFLWNFGDFSYYIKFLKIWGILPVISYKNISYKKADNFPGNTSLCSVALSKFTSTFFVFIFRNLRGQGVGDLWSKFLLFFILKFGIWRFRNFLQNLKIFIRCRAVTHQSWVLRVQFQFFSGLYIGKSPIFKFQNKLGLWF